MGEIWALKYRPNVGERYAPPNHMSKSILHERYAHKCPILMFTSGTPQGTPQGEITS